MAKPTDQEVTDLARRLARAGSGAQSRVYSMSFWNEKLLEWAMSRPEFKAQLFRLVDVFPATTDSADVLRHVREYLSGPHVPSALRAAIGVANAVPLGDKITAAQARTNVERMAKQFILGTTAEEAAAGATRLWADGSGTVVDLLGEKTVSESEADTYAARILATMETLAEAAASWDANPTLDQGDQTAQPRVQISIKPTALASKYKPLTHEAGLAQAKERIRPMLRRCLGGAGLVWFDMEHYEVKGLIIRLFKELLSEPEFVEVSAGLVMQAYLLDTYDDLAELIRWSSKRQTPVSVRLVKGAYWDTETIVAQANDWPIPVFQRKSESDANYERCSRLLIDHIGKVNAAFASHNLRSLAYAISYAHSKGVPDSAIEVQMLYGMAEPMHEAVKKEGLRLRVYAPVGEVVPGMSYLVRRLLENTSNESFVRLRFADNQSIDSLIAPPDVDNIPAPEPLQPKPVTQAADPSAYHPEPPAQWFEAAVVTQMSNAIAKQQSRKEVEVVDAFIDDQWVATSQRIDSLDPSNGTSVVASAASCSKRELDTALTAATEAQRRWAATPVATRAQVLFDTANWMRQRRFELCALEVQEAGKPWAEADGDVCEAIDFCEYYGRQALLLECGGVVDSPPGEANRLRYEPRGVGAVIAPWNFPLAIPTGMTVAALVTGNAVLLKPAEQTPLIAAQLVKALQDSGLPRGVLAFLPGHGETIGAAMVQHPQTSFVAFTGSKPVGLSILEQAAIVRPGQRHIKRVVVELGGKNPMIVDSDADLDQVVPAVLYSAFGFGGQKCSALSRLIVHDSVADALFERLEKALPTMKVGDPSNPATEVPPLIDADAQRRINSAVEQARRFERVLATNSDHPDKGFYSAPTIVVDVEPNADLAKTELFGPVLSCFRFHDLDEALKLANDTDFCLTAGLFSRSPSVIERVANEIRASNVYVNRAMTGSIVGRQPFGGNGLSGGGSKAGGPDYLLNFVDPRVVTENTVRQGFAELT